MTILKKTDLPTYTEKLVDAYSREDLRALLAAAKPEERLIFDVFIASGCREQEVMHLGPEDVDFESGLIRVREKPQYRFKPKDGEERDIPVPDTLLEKLRNHIAANPVQRLLFPVRRGKPDGHFLRRLQTVALRAGLNCGRCVGKTGRRCAEQPCCHYWTLHKFRRTFATFHHEAGVSIRTLMSWTGHSDLETLMRYLAVSDRRSPQTRALVNRSFLALAS